MNPTIKARIEKIKNGEVPEGYKRTKAGILPLDWEYGLLNQVADKVTTKNRGKNFTKILTNSANEGIVSQTDYFDKQIANADNIEGYYVVKKGYFVYNPRISVAAPCGPINCYHGDETGVMSPLYTVFALNSHDVNTAYIEHYFVSSYWYKYMKSVANYGVRSDRMNLTDEDFFLLPIPMPPIVEQQKIAEILVTQDKVIELKEKLLKEKQRQKKYLMQQLLTGKKRLSGFSGEWKETKLGKVCSMFSGGTPRSDNKDFYFGNIPFIRSAEIDLFNTELFITELGYKNSSAKMIQKGDLLYALYGANSGDCAIAKQFGAINQAILCIRSKSESILYIYYNLMFQKSNIVNKYLQGGQGNLSAIILKNVFICLPSLPEQNAIAQILSTADKEIELLKKDIEQEKLKKKSLMQLLLTGIVRVN